MKFWQELCGTHMAKKLGITELNSESLARFDNWYFDFYPYLDTYINFEALAGKNTLEVGLGYGSVSSKLMEFAESYTGVDVAKGPVELSRQRARYLDIQNSTHLQPSVLELPFSDQIFDSVISIGCLHHTGDLAKAISEISRVLKIGGKAHIMVYNALSYRQWTKNPFVSFKRLVSSPDAMTLNSVDDIRYDANIDGVPAPYTCYVKKSELQLLFGANFDLEIVAENIGSDGPFRFFNRSFSLKTFGSWLGLDLYLTAEKRSC